MDEKIIEYIETKVEEEHQEEFRKVLDFVSTNYPNLELVYKWAQPMFLDHGVFILGVTAAKKHLSIAPEGEVVELFSEAISELGFDRGKKFIKIPWGDKIDYDFLKQIIEFNIKDKKDATSFWRTYV